MKVVFINTFEASGGAAIAANRLMSSLLKEGVKVKTLVRDKQSDSVDVVEANIHFAQKLINKWRFLWERVVIFLNNGFNREKLFQVSIANTGVDISKHPLVKEADIIHLHWINQGFLSLSNIGKLFNTGKPIVWTMHDMWPCTAICHHARECSRYEQKCGKCNFLNSNKENDLSYKVFIKKKKINSSAISYVPCSRWLKSLALKSSILEGQSIIQIPNPIDIGLFRQIDRQKARQYFQLPAEKTLLLFVAAKVSDQRKGIQYLIETCKTLLKNSPSQVASEYEILLIGNASDEFYSSFPFPVRCLGYLKSNEDLVNAYSSADLFITPSLEDNLPNTIMEAMACGTPCVGFNVGGIPEMIDHKKNGYVANYKDAEDLAQGIQWVLENSEKEKLSEACIQKVKDNYSESVVAKQYIQLYQSLVKK